MSEQSPYETLQISADASFEEVQAARDRLLEGLGPDDKQRIAVDTAYDAVLMHRLRMRQENKIPVPERIRFPEKQAEPLPTTSPLALNQSPNWLKEMVDTPSRADILWPAGVFVGLGSLSLLPISSTADRDGILQVALAFGIGCSLFFLNRKERRFLRAFLLTFAGLVGGLILGSLMIAPFESQLAPLGLTSNQVITLLTFLMLWAITSFLR
jgi:Protein CHAPERONE-LIKE PROTEIN OF POR1-like